MRFGGTFQLKDGDLVFDTITRRLQWVSGRKAVAQSIEIAIETEPGSNFAFPAFGFPLKQYAQIEFPLDLIRTAIIELVRGIGLQVQNIQMQVKEDKLKVKLDVVFLGEIIRV